MSPTISVLETRSQPLVSFVFQRVFVSSAVRGVFASTMAMLSSEPRNEGHAESKSTSELAGAFSSVTGTDVVSAEASMVARLVT